MLTAPLRLVPRIVDLAVRPSSFRCSRPVAWAVSQPDHATNTYLSRIVLGTPTGHQDITANGSWRWPQWDWTGQLCAADKATRHIVRLGGRGQSLAVLEDAVTGLTVHSDGTFAAVTTARSVSAAPDPRAPDGWPAATRVDGLPLGMSRRRLIKIVDLVRGRTVLTLGGDAHDAFAPAWHPRAHRVAYLRRDDSDASAHFGASVRTADVERSTDSPVRPLAENARPGLWQQVLWADTGLLLRVGHPDPLAWPAPLGIWADGPGGLVAQPLECGLMVCAGGRVAAYEGGLLAAAETATGVVAALSDPARAPFRVRSVTDIAAAGDTLAVASWQGERERVDVRRAGWTPLQDQGRTEARPYLVSAGGMTGWLHEPDAPADGLLLLLLGAPVPATPGHYDEVGACLDRNIAVLVCNPRYWRERPLAFAREPVETCSNLVALLGAAAWRSPALSRVPWYLWGGSFGGLVAAWAAAVTDCFSAVVIDRPITNWASLAETADVGAYWSRMFLGDHAPDDLLRLSPISVAGRFRSPVLIIAAELDHRTPMGQALELRDALAAAGKEPFLLVVPGEGHELPRAGTPTHRLARLEGALDWLRAHRSRPTPTRSAT